MEGLGAAASVIAVLELAAKVASLCLEYSSAVKSARSDIERLRKHTNSLKITVDGAQELLQGPAGARLETSQKLLESLKDTYSQLGGIATKLEAKLNAGRGAKVMRRMGLRAMKWPFESKDVDEIIANLQRDQASFSAALQIDQTVKILDISRIQGDQTSKIFDISRKIDLSKLPVVRGAAFDSQANEHDPKCHPDTRVDLLAEIDRWIEDPDGKCIFWLCGMAGTGKSTISRTVAGRLSARKVPSASFLFKKGDGDRGKAAMFFTTIASQLAHQLPSLASHVQTAIEVNPTIADKTKGEQFEKLILEPLNKYKDDPCVPSLVSVVVDALDECDREDDAIAIVRILSRAKEAASVRLRCFITSRPELPIRLGFGQIQGDYQDVALHRIPEPIVKYDISAFLRHELASIRDRYNSQAPEGLQVLPGWPGEDIIGVLAQMAVPLFIFAATVCRFVEDKGRSNPTKRLKKVLDYRTATHDSRFDKLDATYLLVLNQLISGCTNQEKADLLAEFQNIVGPIVLLARPLSVRSLALLLNVGVEDVHDQLNSLHSVLDIPSHIDDPVRLFHLSFRDFLVDRTKSTTNDFWIDETEHHKTLTDRCIQVMEKNLKRDICGLQVPGRLRSEVDQQAIEASLPPEIQYACRISESIGMVDDLLALSPADAIEISGFLRDIKRFVQSSLSIIDIAPLQVYASALVFSPACSITRVLFKQEERRWITVGPVVENDWNACIQTLEGHGSSINSVTFSPNSKLVASGSYDNTIKIWDAATGACMQTLEGHSSWVYSITFSPDSTLMASGSQDNTIKIWDAVTGICIETLIGHSGSVNSVVFSPDLKLIVSGSDDNTIKIWDVATGTYIQTLTGHSSSVNSVIFSPDLKLIVSGSDDNTIKIWDVATGTCIQTLEGHSGSVRSIAFSPDLELIASGSKDTTIKIWDVATGTCTQTLKGHSDCISSVTFSPDLKLMASGSNDTTVKIWDAATGTCTQTLKGHGSWVRSVTFSPDSKLVASGSNDTTVKIWDAATGTCMQMLEGHSDWVRSVMFSPDSKLMASGSDDNTVKIWDAATGTCMQMLEGHSDWVRRRKNSSPRL
ncbi:hypothetical protein B0T25DRAFT_627877 [Lasiosphaeria hispida]|uniref:Nephrocystin 3-like N-terminal domain-containing protein n=1 Tax=Lasiosphaeria hispida TaxID=260671 RepID=A0AAJ0HW00_9PEZI|nr:hypothetical protein B0T25DRAFT_627877 [Lasiosphaeria hispida]